MIRIAPKRRCVRVKPACTARLLVGDELAARRWPRLAGRRMHVRPARRPVRHAHHPQWANGCCERSRTDANETTTETRAASPDTGIHSRRMADS